MFRRILVANRGEIAVRVIRACHQLGIEAVAVYSEADAAAPHVRLADRACCIGPPPARESYLNVERLLAAARATGAGAVHPGYGFLSENAAFVEACETAGLAFIGPTAAAQRLLGNKVSARRVVAAAGVPVVPGSEGPVRSLAEAEVEAERIGYPVLVKAAAGGGGKGMRAVREPAALAGAIQAAVGEATSSFADAEVYLERLIRPARHVEVQILADHHGTTVHLGERECSVQRRHQKLVEESPSMAVDADLRRRMGETAVAAVRAAGYRNAGTVEFLLAPDGQFYFLEVNARLQVEHPVTEMVAGLDLVQLQIRVAAGERLPFSQGEVRLHGHAIEGRIFAEDPERDFAPSTGRILALREPGGPGVRVDSGVEPGSLVSIYYDPLLAKLICWGEDRAAALARLREALDEYRVLGVKTTVPFLRWLADHPQFVAGALHTEFVGEHWQPAPPSPEAARRAALAAALAAHRRGAPPASPDGPAEATSRWRQAARLAGLR